jgi:hypothetical protein
MGGAIQTCKSLYRLPIPAIRIANRRLGAVRKPFFSYPDFS